MIRIIGRYRVSLKNLFVCLQVTVTCLKIVKKNMSKVNVMTPYKVISGKWISRKIDIDSY